MNQHRPKRCCVRAFGFAPERPASFRAVGALFLEDDWSLGATKSLLGDALTALKRYEEAEAVLLDARRDLQSVPAMRGSEMKDTITRLVALYVAWGKTENARAYRSLLGS